MKYLDNMERSGSYVGHRDAKKTAMSQRGDEESCVSSNEVDRHGQAGIQINDSVLTQPLKPHRSVPIMSNRSDRSIRGRDHVLALSEYRSGADLNHLYQPSLMQPFLSYTSRDCRSDQYPIQPPGSQFQQPPAVRMDYVVRRPFAEPVAQVRQRNEIRYLHPSRVGGSRTVLDPGSASKMHSAQAAIEASLERKRQVQSSLLSTATKCPQQQSPSRQILQPTAATQVGARKEGANNQSDMPTPKPLFKILEPTPLEWTTYRVDTKGTRIPKTQPPPQGTYKASEGLGRTDYSDPRDFFAPSMLEQQHVWSALRPTRITFYELTHVQLQPNVMRTLYMGYNAAWNEIKRRFVQWVYENFSPDRLGSDRTTVTVQNLSYEVPEYGAEEQQVVLSEPYNPKNIKYFANGEIAMSVDDLLPRLERWYGLIEDYRFSPTWPYERQRNSGGFLIQNPDCFACMHCRTNQIVCYGFRERADRKCTPCEKAGLSCSIGEDIVENRLIRC